VHPALAQGLDVVALSVQRIDNGDHGSGQIDAGQGVQQRGERSDLVRLVCDLHLTQQSAGVVIDHREQMPTRRLDPGRVDVTRAVG
jgi:hypothetical protein